MFIHVYLNQSTYNFTHNLYELCLSNSEKLVLSIKRYATTSNCVSFDRIINDSNRKPYITLCVFVTNSNVLS